jgi:hypothetical protein
VARSLVVYRGVSVWGALRGVSVHLWGINSAGACGYYIQTVFPLPYSEVLPRFPKVLPMFPQCPPDCVASVAPHKPQGSGPVSQLLDCCSLAQSLVMGLCITSVSWKVAPAFPAFHPDDPDPGPLTENNSLAGQRCIHRVLSQF